MPQSDPFTVTQHKNAGEWSSSNEHVTLENLVRNADWDGHEALVRETSVQTTTRRDLNLKASAASGSSGRRQDEDSFSWMVDFQQRLTPPQPTATFHALQEWEGFVLEIGETDFVARLVDLTAGMEQEEEEAVIPLAELSDEDFDKMRLGSIFRWVIGYERTVAGTKRRVSQIVFRDLPAITKMDLRDGEKWAHEIIRSLSL